MDIDRTIRAINAVKPKGLRPIVLALTGAQIVFWLYLWIYIGARANPKGDGTEWVAIAPATLILGIFVLPPLTMAWNRQALRVATALAVVGAGLNVAFFLEIAREFAESAPH
jgi:hypothetical protein